MHPVERKETRYHPFHGRDLATLRNKPHPDAPILPHVSNSKPHPKSPSLSTPAAKNTLLPAFNKYSATCSCRSFLEQSCASTLCKNTRISCCQLKINDTSNTCCSQVDHFHPCASLSVATHRTCLDFQILLGTHSWQLSASCTLVCSATLAAPAATNHNASPHTSLASHKPTRHVSQNVHPNIDAGATGNNRNLSFHWLGIWIRFWPSAISAVPVTTASM